MRKWLFIFLLFIFPVQASTLDEDYEQMRPIMDMLSIKSAASINLLMPYAEQGNSVAQYLLGAIYEDGDSVDKNLKKAFEFYSMAAEKNPLAALRQADMLLSGEGTEYDLDKAEAIYRRLVNDKDVGEEAVEKLKLILQVQNQALYFEEIEKNALAGNQAAQLVLAQYMLSRGNFVGAYVWFSIVAQDDELQEEKIDVEEFLNKLQGQMTLSQITQAEKELEEIQKIIKNNKKE